MEERINDMINSINIHVLPIFVIYAILRSRFVYKMLISKVTAKQAIYIVVLALLAIEMIHVYNPVRSSLLMSATIVSWSILNGMLFGRLTGVAIGFLGGVLVLFQGSHNFAVELTVMIVATFSGWLSQVYKARHGNIWENRYLSLKVSVSLIFAALTVVNIALYICEPWEMLAREIYISLWKISTFVILILLVQRFILERVNISNYDVLAGEMMFARKLQLGIVTHKEDIAVSDRAQVVAVLLPAKDVGGDWYDYFTLSENKVCFVIGDVSGKGVPAALFMVVGCMIFRSFRDHMTEADPAKLLEVANNYLCEDNKAKMFITAICAILDTETGELTYSSVGHTKGYVVRTDGTITALPITDKGALGVRTNRKYSNEKVQLLPGDVFLTYTDGVTEAQNTARELFGSQRLENLLSIPCDNAEEICKNIVKAVNDFSMGNEQSDDITVLAVKYHSDREMKL